MSSYGDYVAAQANARLRVAQSPTSEASYNQALAEGKQIEMEDSQQLTPCPQRCGANILPCLAEDHAEVCTEALLECPLRCGVQPMARSRMWRTHLASECSRYVILCSSFRCARTNDAPIAPPRIAFSAASTAFSSASPASASASASSSSSSSSSASASASLALPPRGLLHPPNPPDHGALCMFGCNVLRTGPEAQNVHYYSDRALVEQQRLISDPSPPLSSPPSSMAPTGLRLEVCPCCLQRLLVFDAGAVARCSDGSSSAGAVAAAALTAVDDELSLASNDMPLKRIPLHDDSYRRREDTRDYQIQPTPEELQEELQEEQRRQQLWNSYTYRMESAPPKPKVLRRLNYNHQPAARIISPEAALAHVRACTARRDAAASAAAAAAAAVTAASVAAAAMDADSSSESASSSVTVTVTVTATVASSAATAHDLAATGIFKFHPLVADCVLGWIPSDPSAAAAAAAAATASTSSSSSASSSSSSSSSQLVPLPLPASGGVVVLFSFSHLLAQLSLLRQYKRVSSPSSSVAIEADFSHAVEQLFIHGACLSDLTNLYDAGSNELHPGMRGTAHGFPARLDLLQVQERIGRLQRPLIFPFLVPHCIPDLARMVLDYI